MENTPRRSALSLLYASACILENAVRNAEDLILDYDLV